MTRMIQLKDLQKRIKETIVITKEERKHEYKMWERAEDLNNQENAEKHELSFIRLTSKLNTLEQVLEMINSYD